MDNSGTKGKEGIELLKDRAKDPSLRLAIFDQIPMPVWACTPDCKIVFWNAAAARLYDYTEDEALGKDFVNLFVNKPEREQARLDAKKIVEEQCVIKNMADDIDKHGNTRRLVTHCFPIYNVAGYEGLQVEISYEIQDVERLGEELASLQRQHFAKIEETKKMQTKLLETTRERTLNALSSVMEECKASLSNQETAILEAKLKKHRDEKALADAQKDITYRRTRLVKWQQKKRKEILALNSVEELDKMEVSIEAKVGLD